MLNQTSIITARQPILDENLNVFGYEFFYRSGAQESKSTIQHTAESDTSTILNLFSNFNLKKLLNGKKASLNCNLEEENAGIIFELLNSENVILEVGEPTDNKKPALIDDIYKNMMILKSKGFQLAGSESVFEEKFKKWLEVVHIIKFKAINYNLQDKEALEKLSKFVRLAKSLNKIIIVEMVETQNQFDIFKKFKFDYYQGYFFSKPINLSSKITNPSLEVMIKLINLVNNDADFSELEVVLKREPTITFKLLRYLNAIGVGGGEKVHDIRRAISILGSKKLLKWVTILFSSIKAKSGMDAISKMALVRAKLMEILAKELKYEDQDAYFITGLFSLLDVMLDIDISVSLESIDISDEIKNSIIKNEGRYVNLLNLAKYLESGDWIDIYAMSYKLNINNKTLSQKYMEAVHWAENFQV